MNNSESLMALKRGRSPTLGPVEPRVKRWATSPESDSNGIWQFSIWPGEVSDPDGSSQKPHGASVQSDIEMKGRSSFADRQLLHDHPLAEGYGNATVAGDNANVGVISNELSRLSISSIQVRQESESSVMLGLKFDNEEWTSSFWNEGQSPVSRNIRSQSAGLADRNNTAAAGDTSRPRSCLQLLLSQVRPASFLDEPRANQQEPVGALHQFSMPIITLNDGAITDKTLSVTQPSVTSTGSDSSGSREANKGVTYPSRLDDIMVGI
ncbi:hypothetical protein DL95DRAFT_417540 [Leptodontidium sp. 2 PMI_412]|nr:hypothetical protein DL95DRAFT_417540 [Leptodontidium sp. 2 PMI_412]